MSAVRQSIDAMKGEIPPSQGGAGAGTQEQPLPQTGLQRQLASLNALYSSVQGIREIGFDPRQQQFMEAQSGGTNEMGGQQRAGGSLDQLARNLAQRYGLAIGRGRLVDEQGNFLMTPDQLSAASGGSMTQGEAAVKMNFIAEAISKQQHAQANQKSIASLETGLGQVQSRGRGSLAGMQSGFYQNLSEVYQRAADRGDYESADFSAFITLEQQRIQQELQRRAEDLFKKQSRAQVIMGVANVVGGILSGNVGGAVMGGGQIAAGSAGSGWF